MSIFLTFHEKVYLILTNLGEKLEFWTISEKSDQNPSTALVSPSLDHKEQNCFRHPKFYTFYFWDESETYGYE